MRKRPGMVDSLTAHRSKLVAVLLVHVLCGSYGASGFSKLSDLGSAINMTNAWVTAMVGDDLHSEANVKRDVYSVIGDEKVERDTEVEPAFTSIDSMLQWAIGHADPEKLKGAAQEVQRMTPQELEKRRAEIRELVEKLRMPSDADLMKIAIADLHNVSLPADDRKRALDELLILVEPIDNASDMADLNKLGGLVAVIGELDREEAELRTAAAAVLGMASQNNPIVQAQLLRQGVLPKLIKMARSLNAEEAVKAFHAVSAIIRNYPTGHEIFYLNGGVLLLTDLMSNANVDTRLRKKALFLVGDLAEQRIEAQGQLDSYTLDNGLLQSVVGQTESIDLDTQQKALDALKSLYGVNTSIRETLREVCHVEAVLERLRLHLEKLMSEPDQERAEFIKDLEELTREVAELFASKDESGGGARLKDDEILYL